MKIKNEKLVSILFNLIIILTYFIAFDRFINVAHIIIAFICFLVLVSLKGKLYKFSFYKSDYLFVFFAIYCIVSSILMNSVDGVKYSVYLISAIVLAFCVRNYNKDDIKIFPIIVIMSTIFSIVTIIFNFLPALKNSIYFMIYSYPKAVELSQLKGIAGLAGQTGLNAFYIGIGIITLFVGLINNRKVKSKSPVLNFALLLINCIAFMLTQKRGPLIFLVLAIIYIYLFVKNREKRNVLSSLFNIVKVLIIILIIYGICSIIMPDTINVFTRFINQTDITNGREKLYNLAISLYKQHKILGIGINNFPNYAMATFGTKIAAHNVLLQILCETGIFITIYFVFTVITNLKYGIKNAKKIGTNEIYAALGIHVFFILYGFTGNSFYDFSTLIIYFLILYYKSKEISK